MKPSRSVELPDLHTVTFVACVALGLMFTVLGALKLIMPPPEAARLALGEARWVHVALGLVELGGGLFLLWPRTVPLGAGMLAVLITGLVALLLLRGERSPLLLLPLLGAISVVTVGYLRRPGPLAAARMRSVLDRYAEKQIREEHRRLA